MADSRKTEIYDHVYKYIIIGDSGTGKSCLLHRFIENRYNPITKHTIGVEFSSRILDLGTKVKVQAWDTSGQERFKSVTRNYYRGAMCAVIVYDITKKDTFEHVSTWLEDVRALASPDIVLILVGNKSDLHLDRETSFLEGTQLAQQHSMYFYECSSLTGENVEEIFIKAARAILAQVKAKVVQNTDNSDGAAPPSASKSVTLSMGKAFQDKTHSCCVDIGKIL